MLLLTGFPAAAQYHSADTNPGQQISLSALLRVVQFFNSGGYHTECGTEDNFAPGPGSLFECAAEGEETIELPGCVALTMAWIPARQVIFLSCALHTHAGKL